MRTRIYYTVYDWMIKGLGLRGTKLLVFAYCYSYDKNEGLKATEDEIIEFLSICPRAARIHLKNLFDNGLLYRRKIMQENAGKYEYWPNMDKVVKAFDVK